MDVERAWLRAEARPLRCIRRMDAGVAVQNGSERSKCKDTSEARLVLLSLDIVSTVFRGWRGQDRLWITLGPG